MQLLIGTSRARAAVTARVVTAVTCGILAGLAACNGPERRDDAPDTVREPSAQRPSPRLDKPVTDYTGQEFQALVSALYFGGSAVDSGLTSDTGAAAPPPGTAELIIEAMSEANQVSLGDVGSYGTIVARLRNLGGGNDPTFGTTPGASREYYVIVRPGTNPDTAVVAVVGLRRGPNPTFLPGGNTGTIAPCVPGESAPAYSSAHFGGCTHRGPPAAPAATSFLGVRTLWAWSIAGDAWVSCKQGCCELNMASS